MKVTETTLPGVLMVEPQVFQDARGFFTETYNEQRWRANGLPTRWVQDNRSRSTKNVLRGLHFQRGTLQGKLVSVVYGEVFDVALDVRLGSPTFGKWYGVNLNDTPVRALYLPPGFAHGLCVLSEVAEVSYKCDALYDSAGDCGIRWDDPALGITWPVKNPILSEKDQTLPALSELADQGLLPEYTAPQAAHAR